MLRCAKRAGEILFTFCRAAPMKPSRSEFIPVRELTYHIRLWGDAAAPKLFMVHGWMDVSASFQFLVDEIGRASCRERV